MRSKVNRKAGSRSESECETCDRGTGQHPGPHELRVVDPKPVRATHGQAEASVTGGGGPNE